MKNKEIKAPTGTHTHALLLAEIDLPLCPKPVVIMGLSDRPAMIAQGKWDRGGSRRMMEKSFLSSMERSIMLTLRERERQKEVKRVALTSFPSEYKHLISL